MWKVHDVWDSGLRPVYYYCHHHRGVPAGSLNPGDVGGLEDTALVEDCALVDDEVVHFDFLA